MQRIVTICDNCGTEKKETNHWFKVVVSLRGSFCLLPFVPKPHKTRQIADACGETCAIKIMSRWIQTKSLFAEKLPKALPPIVPTPAPVSETVKQDDFEDTNGMHAVEGEIETSLPPIAQSASEEIPF